MFFKYSVLIMSAFALGLMIISAKAQTTDEDRQAVVADQQALADAYKQLQKDQEEGNAAGVEIDQDNISTAELNFRTDVQRTIEDDQKAVMADQQALEKLSQQVQQDQKGNPGAVETDEMDIKATQNKLQADKQQTVADDKLEVTSDEQALDSENQQLQQDLHGNPYIAGAPSDAVPTDEENIKEATRTLQNAQMKLQIDSSNPR